MNQATERRLSAVHPELARCVRALIEVLAKEKINIEVVQGLRTFAEQDALYAQGRSKPGARVTNARAGQSNHNYGLAVDVCPFENGQPNWNATVALWTKIGVAAEHLGLEWGGRWHDPVDKPHLQLKGLTVGQCFECYQRGGLAEVWKTASARLKK